MTDEKTAILIVADWNTTCSECGANVAASEERHETVLPGYPERSGQPERGCGALFVGMRPAASARIVPGAQPCGWIAQMRPDLPVVTA